MFTDAKGNILNQKEADYFEFSLEKYEEQLAEIQEYAKTAYGTKNIKYLREINEKKSLIENQNIFNHYLLLMKKQLFGANKVGAQLQLMGTPIQQYGDVHAARKIRGMLLGSSPLLAKQFASYAVAFLVEQENYEEGVLRDLSSFLALQTTPEDK